MKKKTAFVLFAALSCFGIVGCQGNAEVDKAVEDQASGTIGEQVDDTISGVADAVERTKANVEQHMDDVEAAAADTIEEGKETVKEAADAVEDAVDDLTGESN